MPAFAFNPANPFWISIKPKLEKYLANNINPKLYQYQILGPNRELSSFLGNRPDREIKFEKLNLNDKSSKKTILANIYDINGKLEDSLGINLEIKIFKRVFMLKQAVKQGSEIMLSNIKSEEILIEPMDERLYASSSLAQKVATIDIPANTPIKINMLRHQKLMQNNSVIKVHTGGNLIKVEMMCRTLGSGDIGEIVNIYCQDSQKKSLRAKILDQGLGQLL